MFESPSYNNAAKQILISKTHVEIVSQNYVKMVSKTEMKIISETQIKIRVQLAVTYQNH